MAAESLSLITIFLLVLSVLGPRQPGPECRRSFGLGAAARVDLVARFGRLARQLLGGPGLADSGRAAEQHDASLAAACLFETGAEAPERLLSPHESLAGIAPGGFCG